MVALRGTLTQHLIESEQQEAGTRAAAEAYAIERDAGAEVEKTRLEAQAEKLRVKSVQLAEGLRARVDALANCGDVAVREALIEQLARVRFVITPFSQDPTPTHVEHVQTASAR